MGYNPEYFDSYHEIPAYRSVYPDENIIRFLVANFPEAERKGKKILDLGCGCGRHLILLKELGFEAYGIDGSPVGVEYASNWLKERGLSADLRIGLITELPYEDNYFDGIIEEATLVNNEWEDILKACDECYRVLQKGGIGFFLLKRKQDCAFDKARKVGRNTYLVEEEIHVSRKVRKGQTTIIFHAFTRQEIKQMFRDFSKVQIHTWDTSFKSLNINSVPGERLTAYWIVIVQK